MMGSTREGSWLAQNGAAQRKVTRDLTAAVFKRRNAHECTLLLALAGKRSQSAPWQSMIVLDEAAVRTKAGSKRPKSLMLIGAPAGWSAVTAHDDPRIHRRGSFVDPSLLWPGKPGGSSVQQEMSPDAVLARGKRLYGHCMSCHQPNGRGLPPIYPPLDESEFVTGSPERLARILLHGLQGRIEVHGRKYNQSMPAAPFKSDADFAAIMTYIRQAWDNAADPVDASFVKKVREETPSRSQPWSPKELDSFSSP
jgi:mono/diheme cytochrome c family protein